MDPIRTIQSSPTLGEDTAKSPSESLAGPSTTFNQECFLNSKLVMNGGDKQPVSFNYQVSQEHHETKMTCAGVPAKVSLSNLSLNRIFFLPHHITLNELFEVSTHKKKTFEFIIACSIFIYIYIYFRKMAMQLSIKTYQREDWLPMLPFPAYSSQCLLNQRRITERLPTRKPWKKTKQRRPKW